MSIIQEYPERAVRMAYLATVGGSKVNGVAELHSQLLRDQVLSGLRRLLAGRSSPTSPTASPRAASSGWPIPGCPHLITETIGDGWLSDLDRLARARADADDDAFVDAFA